MRYPGGEGAGHGGVTPKIKIVDLDILFDCGRYNLYNYMHDLKTIHLSKSSLPTCHCCLAWRRPHPFPDSGGGILTPVPAAAPGLPATQRQAVQLPLDSSRGLPGLGWLVLRDS